MPNIPIGSLITNPHWSREVSWLALYPVWGSGQAAEQPITDGWHAAVIPLGLLRSGPAKLLMQIRGAWAEGRFGSGLCWPSSSSLPPWAGPSTGLPFFCLPSALPLPSPTPCTGLLQPALPSWCRFRCAGLPNFPWPAQETCAVPFQSKDCSLKESFFTTCCTQLNYTIWMTYEIFLIRIDFKMFFPVLLFLEVKGESNLI